MVDPHSFLSAFSTAESAFSPAASSNQTEERSKISNSKAEEK